MLSSITSLVLITLAGSVAAQSLISSSGLTYTCPSGDQALQAYSTLCPTSLLDGTPLTSKSLDFGTPNSPTSYKTSRKGDIRLICFYGPRSGGRFCPYNGGAGAQLTLEVANYVDPSCRATSVNSGTDPKPSGGGNFRKRQADVQAKQPTIVCPLAPSNGLQLKISTYIYEPTDSTAPERIKCQYGSGFDYFQCDYAIVGNLNPNGYQAAGRCPPSACSSPQYKAQMAKRSIAKRQVNPAAIRARAPVSGGVLPKQRMLEQEQE